MSKKYLKYVLIGFAIAIGTIVCVVFVLPSLPKTEPTLGNIQNIQFDEQKSEYAKLNLRDLGGKFAFEYKNKDGSIGYGYDGKFYDTPYRTMGAGGIVIVGGKIAYAAKTVDGQAYDPIGFVVVWDGKEYGGQYDGALNPTDVAGKLAYIGVRVTESRETFKRVVVWDEKEYGTEFSWTGYINEIDGKLSYAGKNSVGYFIIIGDKKYGPYDEVLTLANKNGLSVALVKKGNKTLYVVDGVLIDSKYNISGDFISFGDKFAFNVKDRIKSNSIIIYDGKEIDTGSPNNLGPLSIGNKIAYMVKGKDGLFQLFVDGLPVGPTYSENVEQIAISQNGKVAVQVGQRKGCSNTAVYGAVYLDGTRIYEGCSGSPFRFLGDKLLFWKQTAYTSSYWYDGSTIASGVFGVYSDFTLADGKLYFKYNNNGKITLFSET